MTSAGTAEMRAGSRLRKFRPDIEGYRALAICMVVIHHAGLPVYGGVDASFVLSGFLVTSVLVRDAERAGVVSWRGVRQFLGKFFAGRARRLLPAAAVVIAATLVAARVCMPSFQWRTVGLDGLFAAISGINYRLAWQSTDYFAENTGASPLQHYWSLSVEEQFYLMYPLLLLGALWLGRKLGLGRWVLGGTLLAIVGASLYASVTLTASNQPLAYFGFQTRAWELGLGALAALLAPTFARMWQPLAAVVAWGGLGAIGLGSWVISQSHAIPGAVMLWPVLGTVLFIAGGCAHPKWGPEVLFARRPIMFVGRASYCWYLWHWPVLIIGPYATGRDFGLAENMVGSVFALALAVLTTQWLIEPIKQRKVYVEVPRKGLALGGRFTALALAVVALMLASATAAAAPVGANTEYAKPQTIQQEVAAATQATSLSSLAATRVSGVKHDLHANCLASVTDTVAKACSLGDANGDGQVVLIGSSLAWHWIPAVNGVAEANGARLAVFSKGLCPAEPYTTTVPDQQTENGLVKGGTYTTCDIWRRDAYRQIAGLRPSLVIMSSRAEAEATPDAIAEAVRTFTRFGAKVVLIQETPRVGFAAPECLEEVQRRGTNVQRCTASVAQVRTNQGRRDMAGTAARAAAATVIDPNPWLCTSSGCPAVIADRPVYRDDRHLSADYASYLTEVLAAALPLQQK